jgi:hypothetical protein
MCKFCENIRNDDKNEELESPCLAIHEKQITVYFNGLDKEFYRINFCPICGRDLRSGINDKN